MIEKLFTMNISEDIDKSFKCSECGEIIKAISGMYYDSNTKKYEDFEQEGNNYDYCPHCGRYIINTEGNLNSDISELIKIMRMR